ncbi:MAG: hypothetical protein K0R38_4387 [Polyangiaceae bacterium]|jgi:hypothetical protein|nr:hypothetical protein [Polyangiaceae bacterium]
MWRGWAPGLDEPRHFCGILIGWEVLNDARPVASQGAEVARYADILRTGLMVRPSSLSSIA